MKVALPQVLAGNDCRDNDRLGAGVGRIWSDPGLCRIDSDAHRGAFNIGVLGAEYW